MSWVLRLR
uniref:Uncharacterized protein n=1 Tax=Anguilla anguilla TaxID=7936 RepID=A0A0E9PR38_ANGAN